jgi:hypothetical protein
MTTNDTDECPKCISKTGMAFTCVPCCVRWLRGMDRDQIAANAPMLKFIMGEEHMQKVRQAWKIRAG